MVLRTRLSKMKDKQYQICRRWDAEMGKRGRTISIREITCLSYRLINEVWSQDSPLTLNLKRLHGPHEDVKGPGYKSWR